MSAQSDTHEFVSQTYAKALDSPGGCCGASPCGPAVPKGVLAKLAGYSQDELAALPPDAVVNSFGCGNPLAYGEVQPGQVVLDLGSGAGIDLIIAAGKVGPAGKVIGVDMTDAMVERARTNVAAAALTNVEVRKGIIEDLPVETASVDWVISNCVINLSPDKPRVFHEIARVLRAGGRMRVSDVVTDCLPEEIRRDAGLYGSCLAGAISEENYLAGLRAAGLVDVQVVDRMVYEAPQLAALVACASSEDDKAAKLVGEAVGKVWSAIIVARKTGGPQ